MVVKNKKLLISICICILLIVLLYLLFSIFYKRKNVVAEKFQYKLCVLAIFKNETMVLKTWLEHYLHQGVDHFYLIDNDSDDNPLEILQPYIDRGVVTYHFAPEKHNQVGHYRDMFLKEDLKNKTEWLIICDLDEFFYGVDDTLNKTLDNYSEYDVVLSGWLLFGSNGTQIEQPKNILKTIVMREEVHRTTKYIFKPQNIDATAIGVHDINQEGCKQILENEKIKLNHYRIQSKEFFIIKQKRGDVAADVRYSEQNFQEYDGGKTIKDETLKEITERYDP